MGEGLGLLALSAFVAGLVRGFSGFGTAMIYLPIAGQILSPFEAITTLIIMDIIGPLPNILRAIRDGHPRDVVRLSLGMLVALPVGVLVLSMIAPEIFRYAVSLISLLLLVLLVSGYRYHGRLTKPLIYGTGGLGGFLAGSVGIPGPPVIMLYMASPHPPQVVRANTLLFLIVSDFVMIFVYQVGGYLVLSAIATGLLLAVPFLVANIAGAAIFRPNAERAYRIVAYTIILVSALSGLPLFD